MKKAKLKKMYFTSTHFCEWQVFENFEFINFSPKEKRIRKRQLSKGYLVNFSVKINGKTGTSRWKNCCYWLILKKAELTNIFVHVFFFCIFIFGKYGFFRILSVYLFSQMQCKRKFSVHRISSSKCWASNKRCPLISAAFLGIHIEISASLKEALPL